MASSVSALLGASNSTGTTSTQPSGTNPPTEQMFLKLLVSQIQNQDPLNPTDSTQFVSQLSQFSQLEQLIAIRTDIEKNQSSNPPATGNNAAPPITGGLPGSTSTAPTGASNQPTAGTNPASKTTQN